MDQNFFFVPVLKLQDLSVKVSPTNYTKPSTINLHLEEGSDFHCTLSHAGGDEKVFYNTSLVYQYYMEKKLDKEPFSGIHIPIKVMFLLWFLNFWVSKKGYILISTKPSDLMIIQSHIFSI